MHQVCTLAKASVQGKYEVRNIHMDRYGQDSNEASVFTYCSDRCEQFSSNGKILT